MANRVKDPIERNSELLLGQHASPFHPAKKRFEIDALPVINDAYGHIDLGVDYSLGGQTLEHAKGDELVVFRAAEPLGDRLEGHEKAGKVVVLVEQAGLIQAERIVVMAPAQLDQRVRRNRALEMQMQLGLGQRAKPMGRNLSLGGAHL